MFYFLSSPSPVQMYNTYGQLSTAALLYRYGFTESSAGKNPFDLVNVNVDLVERVWCAPSTWHTAVTKGAQHTGALGDGTPWAQRGHTRTQGEPF